jgi:hypothetical protein
MHRGGGFNMQHDESNVEYVKPAVVDYGELRDLTESSLIGSTTDVPYGTTDPTHHVFSLP